MSNQQLHILIGDKDSDGRDQEKNFRRSSGAYPVSMYLHNISCCSTLMDLLTFNYGKTQCSPNPTVGSKQLPV